MGWASYFEHSAEMALDYGLAAQTLEDRFRQPTPILPVQPALRAPPITPRPPLKPTLVISVVDRCRDIRDIHVLCLAELRPNATATYYART
jgi:hypothetical protein